MSIADAAPFKVITIITFIHIKLTFIHFRLHSFTLFNAGAFENHRPTQTIKMYDLISVSIIAIQLHLAYSKTHQDTKKRYSLI